MKKINKLRYKNHTNNIINKKLNLLMILSVILLLLLIYTDYIIRDSLIAVYTRIPSLITAIFILLIINFKIGNYKKELVALYNIFLFTVILMTYAKFLVHLNTDSSGLNTLSIITAIFIISYEIRTNVFYTVIIYFGSFLLFISVLFIFFTYNINDILPLINVFLITIVGFFINRIQYKIRYKNFQNQYLLKLEKQKLFDINKKLEEKNKDLEKFNDLFIGREFRIKELRDKLKELEAKL